MIKSPYDRGSADAYYWRRPDPHWYPEGMVTGPRVTDMTDEQVADYYRGYEKEDDRKERVKELREERERR